MAAWYATLRPYISLRGISFDVEPGELVVEIVVPKLPEGAVAAYSKYRVRKSIDFAVPYMSDNVKYRVELDWKRWIDEGWVDSLVLGDFEWTWDAVPNWKAKGLDTSKLVPGNEPADVFAPEYVDYAKGRVEILFFSSWLSAYAQHHQRASASSLSGAMKMRADTVLKSGADGMLLHEAHTFEYYRGFGTIKEMRRRFDRANRKNKEANR